MCMGDTMECAVDAQSLISMSLRKIHSSRTQRGGVKLHKNLLVSYVLRNARQQYVRERYAEIYRRQQYEEVMTVCSGIQELDPFEVPADAEVEEEDDGAQCAAGDAEADPLFYRSSCCADPESSHCSRTTVLDLDTHVVTTVDSGYLHQDCCAPRKRKGDRGGCAQQPEDTPDFVPCKRARVDDLCDFPSPCPEQLHSSELSNLISMFGPGFTELVSRQADFEQSLGGHFCSKQVLASAGAWTQAIVAF